MDEWVRYDLATKVQSEFELLVRRLQTCTPRLKTLATSPTAVHTGPVISVLDPTLADNDSDDQQVILRIPPLTALPEAVPRRGVFDMVALPKDVLGPGISALEELLRIERLYATRRAACRSDGSDDTSSPRPLIGGKPTGVAGPVVGLSSGQGTRSQLAIPAMIALLRWRLYTGEGWQSVP